MNTKIENCNTELLEEQKKQLEYEIVYGENEGHFAVFDIEAGCRKTRTAEQALITLCKTGEKAIFVRLFNDDCRESANIINNSVGKNIAFAYNNEDVTQELARNIDLESIPILIITHQKYKVLMMDASKRKFFIKGRTTLVIDEFLSAIHTISLGEKDLETYRALFQYDYVLLQAFEKTMKKISDYLKAWNKGDGSRKFGSIADKAPSKSFNELVKLIRVNVTNEILEDRKCKIEGYEEGHENININLLSEIKSVRILCEKIMEYKQFFGTMFLYCNKKLYTTDKRYKYWFLDNNIMLDASGELQIAYSLNTEEFELKRCEKVLDHSKWKIINIPVTTTTSTKGRITNFYDVVNEEIKKYGEDILVVGKKDEMSLIDVREENKAYFGNITGSNAWYDKKNVAIIQTHNLSDVDYILKFLHYSKQKLNEKFNLSARSYGRWEQTTYSFTDSRLEDIRVYWIASEIYQAIKRVNRNMLHATDVIIFLNNEKIISLIKERMKNCSLQVVDYEKDTFQVEKSKQDEYFAKMKQDSYATRFIELLAEVQNGLHPEFVDEQNRISKIKVRGYLGINSSSNFADKVLRQTEVISYCQVRNINLNGRFIKLPKAS